MEGEMKMKQFKINGLIVALCAGLLVTACASYYTVKDTKTGTIYYTQEVKPDGSAATFKDAVSGKEMTVQNSEITAIDRMAFDVGTPAPAATPAPATSAPAP
jgi:hypothetical protein